MGKEYISHYISSTLYLEFSMQQLHPTTAITEGNLSHPHQMTSPTNPLSVTLNSCTFDLTGALTKCCLYIILRKKARNKNSQL